jgi:hypothetical protein
MNDDIIEATLARLTKAAKSGDPAAARKVLRDLLEQVPETAAESCHRARLAEIGDDTVALCHYLGELDASPGEVAARIGHRMTGAEKAAYDAGALERRLEVRAIELHRARRGGKVEPWMGR